MTELTLIRHGQAQTGAQDAAGYDRLSALGHEQARWLGEHIHETGGFDLVLSGTLTRQVDTARSLGLMDTPLDTDGRLNELDYFGISRSLHAKHGVPFPKHGESFATHVPRVLEIWRNGDIHSGLETYDAFRARIEGAVEDAAGRDGRVLLVTSTGVIATLAAIALGLGTEMKSKMFLRVAHTSVHKFELRAGDLHLTQFGATPHLDRPDRRHARTHM